MADGKQSIKSENDYVRAIFEEMNAEFSAKHGIKPVPFDKRYKKRMNRLYKFVGLKKLPYPEVDNLYEKIASKLIKLKYLGK